MRKIKNSPVLNTKVKNFYTELKVTWNAIADAPLIRLAKIRDSNDVYDGITPARKRQYLELIISDFDLILEASPSSIEDYAVKFSNIIDPAAIPASFHNAIVEALGYEKLRKTEFPKIFQQTNIKTCVYCHSLLTVAVNTKLYERSVGANNAGDVRTRKLKFELDHLHAKSSYPGLSISFFNLLPACANCNRAKSFKPTHFRLYTDGNVTDDFRFSLDRDSIIKYWNTRKTADLKIVFQHLTGTQKQRDDFNNMFGIEFIYETQKDIVEELLYKKAVYSKGYRTLLKNNFKRLFKSEEMIKRIVLGNYFLPEDVHKRPMAKFTQDIANDIKLFGKR